MDQAEWQKRQQAKLDAEVKRLQARVDMGGKKSDRDALKKAQQRANPHIGGTTGGGLVKPETRTDYVAPAAPAAPAAPVTPPPNANPSGITAPTGKDLTTPGTGEQFYDWYGGAFTDPGAAQKLWGEVGDQFTTPGLGETISGDIAKDLAKGSQGDSYGQDYWQGIQGQISDPGMIDEAWKNMQGTSADLNPYYDLAFQDTQRQLDRASAARGRFNSSESMRTLGDASARLNAQQAKDESDYQLKRAGLMGDLAVKGTAGKADWLTGMGELAFGAGEEKLKYGQAASAISSQAQENELARLQAGLQAALGVDAGQLARLLGGTEASLAAQDAREGRIGSQMDYTLKLGELIDRLYGEASTSDAGAGGTQIETGLADVTDQQRQQQAEANARLQAILDSIQTGAEIYGNTRTGSGSGVGSPTATYTPAGAYTTDPLTGLPKP